MTTYAHTRTLFRLAFIDLLDHEHGGGTVWGDISRSAAQMISGQLPREERTAAWWPRMRAALGTREAVVTWLRDRAIVRIARACMAAFTPPYTIPDDAMHRMLNPASRDRLDDLRPASLVLTPFAYYRRWWRPTPQTGVATTRRMDSNDAERRAGLERALAAQQAANAAASEARWRAAHESVTLVRPSRAATKPYGVQRPK